MDSDAMKDDGALYRLDLDSLLEQIDGITTLPIRSTNPRKYTAVLTALRVFPKVVKDLRAAKEYQIQARQAGRALRLMVDQQNELFMVIAKLAEIRAMAQPEIPEIPEMGVGSACCTPSEMSYLGPRHKARMRARMERSEGCDAEENPATDASSEEYASQDCSPQELWKRCQWLKRLVRDLRELALPDMKRLAAFESLSKEIDAALEMGPIPVMDAMSGPPPSDLDLDRQIDQRRDEIDQAAPKWSKNVVTTEHVAWGASIKGPYQATLARTPVRPMTLAIVMTTRKEDEQLNDDGHGRLVGTESGATGTIDYATGKIEMTFANSVPEGQPILANYEFVAHPSESATDVSKPETPLSGEVPPF